MYSVFIALLVLCAVAPYDGPDNLIFQDKLDSSSFGKVLGVTFEGGKAIFDAPGDSIEYPAEMFAEAAGRIEFDVKLTKPLSIERPIWCILSDIGANASHWGAINVHWRDKPADFEFGIFDGSAHHWCIAKGIDWSALHHVALIYGPSGMRLEIDGKAADSNDYKGGLARTAKRIGWDDPWNDSAPIVIDNLRTYRTNVDRLSLSASIITPNGDGFLDTCVITYGVASDSMVRLGVVDKFGETVSTLVNSENVRAGEYTFVWDAKEVPDGEYTIHGSGWTRLLGMERITVDRRWKWKEAPPAFDDFFPLGTWYFWEDDASYINRYTKDPVKAREYYESTMKDLGDHGFNLIFPVWTPHDHRQLMLDNAHKNGIKAIVHLDEINSVVASGEIDRVNILEVADNAIKSVKGHPATVGYYMIDEPNNAEEVARRIKLARQALEAVDPKHPGFSCLLGGYEDLLKTVDYQVLVIDIYPLHPNWSGDWTHYLNELERGARNQGDRPLWVILQAFGKPNNAWKIPTPEEVRAQVWLALAHGAKGIIYFIYQSTTGFQGEWLQGMVDMDLKPMDGRLEEVGRINAQIRKLAPTLLKLKPAEFTLPGAPDQVLVRGFADPKGVKYVIMANKDVKREAIVPWTSHEGVDILSGAEVGAAVRLSAGGGAVVRLR